MIDDEYIESGLRHLAAGGASATDLVKWLQQELGARFTYITLYVYMGRAFQIPLRDLRNSFEDWIFFNPNGKFSDADLNRILARWIESRA